MEPSTALLAGLAAGLAIAMQVGAVSLLLLETSIRSGPRLGVAAGMGVATVDFLFAVIAAAAGGVVGAALEDHEGQIRVIAAAVLAAISVHGLIGLLRSRDGKGAVESATATGTATGLYARYIAITAINPLTIVSFIAVATSLSLDGAAAGAAFAGGVGVASVAWHLVLTASAGHARRWMTPRVRTGLSIAGRLAVLALAVHLALR